MKEELVESKAPLARCYECPLKDEDFVPGDPDTTTEFDVIAVGEAPGVNEVNEGQPFVGASGQLLRKVLAHNKIDPIEVYYTNAVLCKPPHVDGKQTPPNAKALKACRERLLDEINQRKPKHIIAVGAKAAQTLLKERSGITSLRKGKPRTTDEIPGAEIIPTFHTAGALRDPDLFPSIVFDIGKITRPIVKWEPTKVTVATPGNANALLRDQLTHAKNGLLTGDIELDEPYDMFAPIPLCFGISERPGVATVYPAEVLKQIAPILDEGFKDRRWGWQNGQFDIQRLWSLGMKNAKIDEDSLLSHYSTDERKGTHDLEQIGTEILGAPYWKEEARKAIEEEKTLSFLSPEKLYEYNGTDADVTYRLLEALRPEMESDGVTSVYRDILIPASNAFAHMEYRGIRLDLDHLTEVEEQVLADVERQRDELHEWVANPNSHPQNLKTLWDLGFKVPNTQADTIKHIDHPFVKKLLEYKSNFTIYSRYVNGLRKWEQNGRIHSRFMLYGTETGRTSSREPNLQNIPVDHPVRETFVPSEGNVFIEADYAGIEGRVIATVAQEPELQRRFRDGRNPNKELAARLYGDNYSARQYINTKSVVYGTAYMETYKHLAHRLGMKPYEAKKIQDAFFRDFPRIKDYHRDTIRQIRENAYLSSMYGRKRRFWLITRDNAYDINKEGINFRISSVASDILTSALIKIHQEKPYLNPVNDVHDSLIFDVPAEHGEEAMREIVQMMESVNPLDVPLVAEAERSTRWKMKKT